MADPTTTDEPTKADVADITATKEEVPDVESPPKEETSADDAAEKEPEAAEKSGTAKMLEWVKIFYSKNEFLILIVLAILIAKAYPPLGAIYVAPKITATWIAVMFIFLLAGLGLKTEEFTNAIQLCKFNSFVFFYNFGVDSAFVFGVSRFLLKFDIIVKDLADGMVIAACLPLTINMCVVLTQASGGDVAAAICNTAIWNLVGVFLSPTLILRYLGVTGDVDVLTVFIKLATRVLLPIVVGQVLKYYSTAVTEFVKKYKPYFKQAQMYALVFIVYTVFARTFNSDENQVPVRDIFIMIVFVFLCLTTLMIGAWFSLKLIFNKEIALRVTGLFCCSHKTVAMGIPLINAMYDGNPAIAMYTLPLLIWHPMQLVIGTFLSPRLLAWVESFEGEGADGAKKLESDAAMKDVEGTTAKEPAAEDSAAEEASPEGNDIISVESVEMHI